MGPSKSKKKRSHNIELTPPTSDNSQIPKVPKMPKVI